MDPKKNFLFLKTSIAKVPYVSGNNFATQNIANFLENMGMESKEQELKKKKQLIKMIKPVHDYTIYNAHEKNIPGGGGGPRIHLERNYSSAQKKIRPEKKFQKFRSDTKLAKQIKNIVYSPHKMNIFNDHVPVSEVKPKHAASFFNTT